MIVFYHEQKNKIAIRLEKSDDFSKSIVKIKEFLRPYEFCNSEKIWLTEKLNLLIIQEVFPEAKINDFCKRLYEKQKSYIEQLKLDAETPYTKKIKYLSENVHFYPHQPTGINFLTKYTNSILGDQQGLGKTLTMISTLSVLFDEGKINKAIVICPKTLKYNWVKEINKYSKLTCSVLEGTKEEKIQQLSLDCQIYITNFDSLIIKSNSKKSKKKFKEETLNLAKKYQKVFKDIVDEKTCLVLDEAHRIKSGSSKISKFIRQVGKKTNFKYALTGTPIDNKPEDVFYLMMFLDGGKLLGTNYNNFLNQYCILAPNPYSDNDFSKVIVGYKNLDKLRFLLGLKMLRRLKDVVKGLPEKIYEDRIVEMSNEHNKCYHDLRKNILMTYDENGDKVYIEKCLMRLIQCSSNPKILDVNIESSKIKELDNLLEEHIEKSNNKVILWTTFIKNYPLLVERYKKYNAVFINGSVEAKERQNIVDKFQEDENVKLIICNPKACKEGLTLTAANVAIYLDRSYILNEYLQSQDRIHRIGQSKTCHIINLICKGSVDEIISETLFTNETLAAYLQGDTDKINKKENSQKDLLKKALFKA